MSERMVGYSVAATIAPDQELIPVQKPFKFGDGTDEILVMIHEWHVNAFGPFWTWSWRTRSATLHPVIPEHMKYRVLRGQEGTTAVPHADGAEIVWLDT
jgi:hypothetical protein